MSYRFKTGFTLIEMIVVIAIFGIVTAVVLANLPTFRDRSSLDLVAQEVAINIRGAQVFGGVGRVGLTNFDSNNPTYGINFNFSNSPISRFTLFADKNNNKRYDQGGNGDESEQVYQITGGFEISKIEPNDLRNIIFTRPNLEPTFAQTNGITIDNITPAAIITIRSKRTLETREVKIYPNGQISVENPNINPPTNP